MEYEADNYNNCDWCFWHSHLRIIKGTGGLRGRRTSGDHPNYNIIENGQNTEKSPEDLRRLAVDSNSSEKPSAKTDVKNSQEVNNNNDKALHPRDDIDSKCQEKKEEEDLPALKIASMHQYNNTKTT